MKPLPFFMALYMLVGSFFPRTDFSQLIKVSNVLEHYREHLSCEQESDNELSLLNFIEIHFISPDAHLDFPGHEHGDLPFYTVNTSQYFTIDTAAGSLQLGRVFARIVHQFFYASPRLSNFAAAIFHPPVMG